MKNINQKIEQLIDSNITYEDIGKKLNLPISYIILYKHIRNIKKNKETKKPFYSIVNLDNYSNIF